MVHALAAAVRCVLLWARAPPLLEAVFVDPLGGAAAGARLHERAVVFIAPAQPAPLRLRLQVLRSDEVATTARNLVRRGVIGDVRYTRSHAHMLPGALRLGLYRVGSTAALLSS
eukprot:scaffold30088_cov61-Phaeocystis_antarctica.AAC.4